MGNSGGENWDILDHRPANVKVGSDEKEKVWSVVQIWEGRKSPGPSKLTPTPSVRPGEELKQTDKGKKIGVM